MALPRRARKRGKKAPRVPFGGTVTDMPPLYASMRVWSRGIALEGAALPTADAI